MTDSKGPHSKKRVLGGGGGVAVAAAFFLDEAHASLLMDQPVLFRNTSHREPGEHRPPKEADAILENLGVTQADLDKDHERAATAQAKRARKLKRSAALAARNKDKQP